MKNILRKILLIICVCVFLYSSYQLVLIYLNYQAIENGTTELIEEYITEPEVEEVDPLERVIDFDALLERNEDVIGWIYIPDTKIDEPILKGENNDSYLRRDIDKKKLIAGQIFIDEINSKDFSDDNTIIYGHNMKNGSRFHDIKKFIKQDYFDEHKIIYIYLPDGTINVYEAFSSKVINAVSDFYQKGIDYQTYINNALKDADCTSEVSEEENPLILLSTCYATGSDERNVVFARLKENVKIGE